LSVGLIPENGLSEEAGILLHPKTRGAIVNESYETSVEGIFACGNVLHVHDLVDFVSGEGKKAGAAAVKYIKGELSKREGFVTEGKDGIGYILPQRVNVDNVGEKVEFMFRVTKNYKNAVVRLYKDDVLFKVVKKQHMAPAEMEKIILKKEELKDIHLLAFEA